MVGGEGGVSCRCCLQVDNVKKFDSSVSRSVPHLFCWCGDKDRNLSNCACLKTHFDEKGVFKVFL